MQTTVKGKQTPRSNIDGQHKTNLLFCFLRFIFPHIALFKKAIKKNPYLSFVCMLWFPVVGGFAFCDYVIVCVCSRVCFSCSLIPPPFFVSLSILFYPCLFVFSFLSLFSQREYAWSRKSREEVDRV